VTSNILVHQQVSLNARALLDFALDYASRGWSIIPVIDKKAIGLWKPFQTHVADDTTLRRLFAKNGITGLAVILGQVSGGLAVRDFDHPNAYQAWANANPHDAGLLSTVKTARGFHVYGHIDDEIFEAFADGELRADSKHYVLLPPSVHPDGTRYSWLNPLPNGDLPALPASLLHWFSGREAQACLAITSTPSKHIACAPISEAIAKTLPTGPGQRNRRLFDLARNLKAIVPEATQDDLRPIILEWHRQALPNVRTKDFSETWTDFVVAWDRVKRPVGFSFRAAARAADEAPFPVVANRYDSANLRQLAALCRELQAQWKNRPFPLSCRKAGEFLGVSAIQGWRLLRVLQFDEVIELVRKGNKRAAKASEWRFNG